MIYCMMSFKNVVRWYNIEYNGKRTTELKIFPIALQRDVGSTKLRRITRLLKSLSIFIVLERKKIFKSSVLYYYMLLFRYCSYSSQVEKRFHQLNLALIDLDYETQLLSIGKYLPLPETTFYPMVKVPTSSNLGIKSYRWH